MDDPADIAELERRLAAAEARAAAAETAMRSAEERLRQALEAGRMEHWIWHPATDTVIRSQSLPDLDGLNNGADWHSGAESFVLVHPDDREQHQAMVEAAGRDGTGWHTEIRIIRPSTGEVGWMEERAAPAIDPVTGERRIIGFTWDVTERKLAEERLRESEDKYRRLFDSIDEGFVVFELIDDDHGRPVDYRYIEANPTFERQTGLYGVVGKLGSEVLTPGMESSWFDTWDRLCRTGEPVRTEDFNQSTGRWYSAYGSRVGGAGSRRVCVVFADVTERRRAEDALRDNEERLSLAIEVGQLASWDWNLQSGKVTWNDRHFLMQGYAVGEVTPSYEAWIARVHPDDRDETAALIEKARQDRTTYNHEFRMAYPDGAIHWCSARGHFFYDATGVPYRMIGVMEDVTERKRSDRALRESQIRQAFLLKLADALRPLGDPVLVQEVTTRMLGIELRVHRCYYAEFDWPRDVLHITREYVEFPSYSVIGDHPISLFQDLLDLSHKGEPLVCDNIATHPVFSREIAAYRERGTDGFILMPLVKHGVMVACMCVTMATPRKWSDAEIDLVREVGDRTWDAAQRARAESAMKESEERFQQFANASSDALWIRGAATMRMEFLSPAFERIYGVVRDAVMDHKAVQDWAALIVPDDRQGVLNALELVKEGHPVTHEFRIIKPDGTFRWVRNTDFPLYDSAGAVERIGGIATDITDIRQLADHQVVLLAELQHRVRNIMAMIRAVANRSADGAEDVRDYRSLLTGRLMALARVQTLLTRQANAGGSLRSVIESEISAQADHDGQYELTGPDIMLSPKAVEVLTLAFHELTTNALKYGALSHPDGTVSITWIPFDNRGRPWLAIDWVERGAPTRPPSTRRGFGSELIEAKIPYELGGTGKVEIEPGGAKCHIELPLKSAESILETDAPVPTKIYGGALDMTGAPDLTGKTILVVEDDYYVASDTAAALRGAGADVLGPSPNEEATLRLLEEQTPAAAVLDLNLGGGGPNFEVARLLRKRGVPFVFLTGYDPDVIPDDLVEVQRLQKPVALRDVVEAVSRL